MNAKSTEKTAPHIDLVGKEIDARYRIKRRIEGDGIVEIYEAEQLSLGRPVVVKMLFVEDGAQVSERFLREARLLSKLDHPGIVHVIEAGVFERFPYLVRDWVEGTTLAALIHEKQKLGVDAAVSLLIPICEALDHAHQHGVIHRDLVPEKIIVGADGRPRIMDFGFARMIEPESSNVTPLTNPGILVGTPQYASPELALGKPVDRRTDLYSLGVIAYRMLAGRLPYDGNTHAQLLASMKQSRAVPVLEAADLPIQASRICAVIDRLLESDPIQRCSSASWVSRALRASIGAEPTAADADEEATLIGGEIVVEDTALSKTSASPIVGQPTVLDLSPAQRPQDPSLPWALPDFSLPPVDPKDEVTAIAKERPGPEEEQYKPVLSEFDIATAKTGAQRAWEETAKVVRNAVIRARMGDRSKSVRGWFSGQWSKIEPPLFAFKEKLDPTIEKLRAQIQNGVEHLNKEWAPQFEGYFARAAAHPLAAKAGDRWKRLPGSVRWGTLASVWVLTLVVLFAVGSSKPPPKSAAALEANGQQPVVPAKSPAEILTTARADMATGEFQKAIDELEPVVVSSEGYGDPALHAALAHAYQGAGRDADALQHFTLAAHKDPTVIADGDIPSLVALLAMPRKDAERVIPILKEVGPRAISYLRERANDKGLPKDERRRAKEALSALGEATQPPAPPPKKSARVGKVGRVARAK
jgi:serine/threonine protein kinase